MIHSTAGSFVAPALAVLAPVPTSDPQVDTPDLTERIGTPASSTEVAGSAESGAAAIEVGRFGPGPLHTVQFDRRTSGEVDRLPAEGLVRAVEDYGAFTMAFVDEANFGGRAALQATGLEFHDEHDLVLLEGFAIDGRRLEETFIGSIRGSVSVDGAGSRSTRRPVRTS